MATATGTDARQDTGHTEDCAPPLWRAVLRGVTVVVLAALVALAVAVAVVPRVMGGAALTVLTGSMEPTYSPGDMVVAVPQEGYDVGDVVTFQPVSGDPTLVTHRIVGVRLGTETRYITRGDANGADDDPITGNQVMGAVVYHIPHLGHVVNAAGPNRGAIVVTVAFLLIGYGAYLFVSDSLAGRRRGSGQVTEGASSDCRPSPPSCEGGHGPTEPRDDV